MLFLQTECIGKPDAAWPYIMVPSMNKKPFVKIPFNAAQKVKGDSWCHPRWLQSLNECQWIVLGLLLPPLSQQSSLSCSSHESTYLPSALRIRSILIKRLALIGLRSLASRHMTEIKRNGSSSATWKQPNLTKYVPSVELSHLLSLFLSSVDYIVCIYKTDYFVKPYTFNNNNNNNNDDNTITTTTTNTSNNNNNRMGCDQNSVSIHLKP